jgi:hypothetical protein
LLVRIDMGYDKICGCARGTISQSHAPFLCPYYGSDLHSTITQRDRLNSLQKALHVFTHDNEELHNFELDVGADKVLCLKLGYAVASYPKNETSISEEIGLICQCLKHIYKCSSNHRLESFRNIAATELLPMLIQISGFVTRNNANHHRTLQRQERDGMIHIMHIFRIFAKLVPAKSILIDSMKTELLGHWIRQILVWKQDPKSPSVYLLEEELIEILGLVKDLTFRSQTLDKVTLLQLDSGIMQHLLISCLEITDSGNSKVQEWITAVLWNFVLDPTTREQLLIPNANQVFQNHIMKGLLQMLMHHSVKKRASPLSTKIRRNAVSAIGNIVSDPRCYEMFTKDDGNSLALCPTLMKLVKNDDDSIVRRRAMRTIRCLVCQSYGDTKHIAQRPSIPADFLIDMVARDVDNDNDFDIQIQACLTVVALGSSISADEWPQLQCALVNRVAMTTYPKLIETASRCLVECIKRSAWRWTSNSFSEIFWQRLQMAASRSLTTHGDISALFIEVAKAEERARNRRDISATIPSILTCTPVINSLTTILSDARECQIQSKENALQVVLMLLENEANKKPLAENEGLLSGLVNLCLMQPTGKYKDSVKRVILDLVPEI